MNTFDDPLFVRPSDVRFTATHMSVDLVDGRTITVPIEWYPRLLKATSAQRANWVVIGDGHGIHWPEIDEDLSIRSLLLGQKSVEYREPLEA